METPAGKLNLRSLRAISAQEAPQAPELPFFGATHLRTGLSRLPVLLSSQRLAAIIAPLFLAAFFWVTVPAFAAGTDIVVVPPSSGSASTATSQSGNTGVHPQAAVPAAAAPAQAAQPAAVPAAAPAAAAPVAAAPAAVPAAAGRAPKAGANDGILRILLVGICLAFSGLALLSAPKRNPHAVVWQQ